MEIREDQAWLLQSRFNPFPVPGSLSLDGQRISFTLGEMAAEAALGWLERELGSGDLATRITEGERVVAFDHALSECEVAWPITGGGALMIVRTPGDRKWVVSYDHPAGGSIAQMMSPLTGRKKAKEWKKALAEAGH